jgi:autotransporter-associated beta strand protein
MKTHFKTGITAGLAALTLATPIARAATHTWNGTGFFGNTTRVWSDPFNWTGGVPTTNEAPPIILVFPDSASEKLSTNDLPGLVIDEIRITGSNYTLFGRNPGNIVTLASGAMVSSTGAGNRIHSSLSLQLSSGRNINEFSVATNQTLRIESVLRGAGGFSKIGGGVLLLDSIASSAYTGTTRVEAGRLDLSVGILAGAPAIPGDLVVGAAGGGVPAEVRHLAADQIADSANITINPSGILQTAGLNDTIGALTLNGGRLYTDGALVTLNGDVTSTGSSIIDGALSLGATNRNFTITDSLSVSAVISGAEGAGIVKKGSGHLSLAGANTYSGAVHVQDGSITADHTKAFGTPAGGVRIESGSSLFIGSFKGVSGESLWMANTAIPSNTELSFGNNAFWNGPIHLEGDIRVIAGGSPSTASINGPISGPGGIIKSGPAPLVLGGTEPNTFRGLQIPQGDVHFAKPPGVPAVDGLTTVGQPVIGMHTGRLLLNSSHQIPDNVLINILKTGTLEVGAHSEVVGILHGTGTIALDGGHFAVDFGPTSGDYAFNGTLNGTGSSTFTKSGNKPYALTASGNYAGKLVVAGSELALNGNLPNTTVEVESGALLTGQPTIDTLTVKNGGTVSPGKDGPGRIIVDNDLNLEAGSRYVARINGATAGTHHDQIRVQDKTTLGGALLDVDASTLITAGQEIALIETVSVQVIAGTFAGLAPNAPMALGSGTFNARYNGGNGNEFVLVAGQPRPVISRFETKSPVAEGDVVTLNGLYEWPDKNATLRLVVNWGDNTRLTTNNVQGGTFAVSHKYADDTPTSFPELPRTIEAVLMPLEGLASIQATTDILVTNRPPVFFPGPPRVLASGEPFEQVIEIIDPGADTFLAYVGYGDSPLSFPVPVGDDRKVTLTHTYPEDGIYQIKLRVQDDDRGEFTWEWPVFVGLNLAIESAPNNQVKLSWSSRFPGLLVQANSEVSNTEWQNLQNAPQLVDDRYVVLLPVEDDQRHFRLLRP